MMPIQDGEQHDVVEGGFGITQTWAGILEPLLTSL